MTLLNSSFQTALQRRYLPVIIGIVLLAVLAAILTPPTPPLRVVVVAVVVLTVVALAYFGLYRALVFRVADRVVLDGGFLRVTRRGHEIVVPVANITGIRGNAYISPETITLELSAESAPSSITFIPPARIPSSREHPIIAQLRDAMRPEGGATLLPKKLGEP